MERSTTLNPVQIVVDQNDAGLKKGFEYTYIGNSNTL